MVGVDLSQAFQVGYDTPRQETSRAPLGIAAAAAHVLAEWFHYGWAVLDAALAAGPQAEPWAIQLRPGHFDAAFDLAKQHRQQPLQPGLLHEIRSVHPVTVEVTIVRSPLAKKLP